ncbi:MAG: hypothetical protein D6729_08310 [Deltaproteobacteria bacterium]|nr:MAG: hypothetical protein D6729_08310 [Deltaproteobacteria bacterium]
MFISLLDREQQEALCKMAQFMVAVDDDRDGREELVVQGLLQESALEEVPEGAKTVDEVRSLAKKFEEGTASRALLLELFGVVLADDVAHPEEMKVIQALAEDLGIDEHWLERAQDYVQRQLELQREGLELLRS